jgi:sporulation protein YlmC with PRC-barrel domain
MTSAKETLHTLKEMRMTPSDPAQDIRSRRVVDSDGQSLGKIDGLLVDDREEKVRFLRVEFGGFLGIGETKSLIPVEAITKIGDKVVTVNQTRERIVGAPVYDPSLVDDRYYDSLYGYYGWAPYWGNGYVYPPYPYYP